MSIGKADVAKSLPRGVPLQDEGMISSSQQVCTSTLLATSSHDSLYCTSSSSAADFFTMIRVRESRKFVIAIALLLSTIFVYITKTHQHLMLPHVASDAVSKHDDFALHQMSSAYNQDHAKEHLKGRWGTSLDNIFNSTLGFQAVSVISLPGRTDRQDSFALAASLTGFTYNLTDGVDGSRVPTKALPYTMDVTAGETGCWRAHLNVWQKMVRDHTSTMLVFEDDAEWDIGLRAQLLEFAKGARFVLGDTGATAGAPYGDDWDLLWIGE